MSASANPLIFLSAGEASGEQYGAALMGAARRLLPGARFFGLGGARMTALGFRPVVRAEGAAGGTGAAGGRESPAAASSSALFIAAAGAAPRRDRSSWPVRSSRTAAIDHQHGPVQVAGPFAS